MSGINNQLEDGSKPESSNKPEVVTLKSYNGEEFSVPFSLAEQSGMIKSVLSEGLYENIPLPAVSGPVLAKLIEFWKNQGEAQEQQWQDKFYREMERDFLFEFLTGANYLDSKAALESACEFVADTIKGMSVEACRDYFGLENDFTPEEEEKIRKESPWAFDNLTT